MDSAVSGPRAAAGRLLVNRDFALLWLGQLLSGLGDQVFETTLVVWIAAELAPDKSWKSLGGQRAHRRRPDRASSSWSRSRW
jgi:hypothetical protein